MASRAIKICSVVLLRTSFAFINEKIKTLKIIEYTFLDESSFVSNAFYFTDND